MNKEDMNKALEKSFESFVKKLADNPDEIFDNDKLQKKYNILLKEKNKAVQELERYKNIIEIMERYFELIIDLSFDYDGLNEVKSLKVLIDELKNYASLGRAYNTTEPIYENNGKKYNILNEELKGE